MFSILSNLPFLSRRDGAKPPKECDAAAVSIGPAVTEPSLTATKHQAQPFEGHATQALARMSDGFDAVLNKMETEGLASRAELVQLRSQVDAAVKSGAQALSQATFFQRSVQAAQLAPVSVRRGGAALQSAEARLAAQEQEMMTSAAHAVSMLETVSETWAALPATIRAPLEQEIANAQWEVKALARNLAGHALTQLSPQAARLLPNHAGQATGATTDDIRTLVFNLERELSAPLQADVTSMTNSLSHVLSNTAAACAPISETTGIAPGVYLLPTGVPVSLPTAEQWSDGAVEAFTKDIARDTLGGGMFTVNGQPAIAGATFDECKALRHAKQKGADEAAKTDAAYRYVERSEQAANEALACIRAAVPPELADMVIGVATQRALLELNALFAANTLGAISAGIDSRASELSNFAISTVGANKDKPEVKVQAWKTCRLNGFVDANARAVEFATPQYVTLTGGFAVTPGRVTLQAASAWVHGVEPDRG